MSTQVKRKPPTTKDKLDAAIRSLTEEDLKRRYEVLGIACGIGSSSYPLVRRKSWGTYPNMTDSLSLFKNFWILKHPILPNYLSFD